MLRPQLLCWSPSLWPRHLITMPVKGVIQWPQSGHSPCPSFPIHHVSWRRNDPFIPCPPCPVSSCSLPSARDLGSHSVPTLAMSIPWEETQTSWGPLRLGLPPFQSIMCTRRAGIGCALRGECGESPSSKDPIWLVPPPWCLSTPLRLPYPEGGKRPSGGDANCLGEQGTQEGSDVERGGPRFPRTWPSG